MERSEKPARPRTPPNVRSTSIHRGLALFYGLLGLTFLVIFGSEAGSSILGGVLVLLIISALHGAIAFGAARSASWARLSSMIVGSLMLFAFPIGTLIGGYLLASLKWTSRDDV